MKRLILPIAILLMLLCACADEGGDGGLEIYRLVRPDYQPGMGLISAEIIEPSEGTDPLDAALESLMTESVQPELQRGTPEGLEIIGCTLRNGHLRLDVSEEYRELEGIERTVADYCLTMTLCSLEGICTVSVYCGNEALSLGMTPADVLLKGESSDPSVRTLRLYFARAGGQYLGVEQRELEAPEEMTLERLVIEQLLSGPESDELYCAVPEGTRLMSVSNPDGLCTVHLSSEFITGMPETADGQRLALYSIVNSLTSLASVDTVRLTVSGSVLGEYGGALIDEPLSFNESIASPANGARGELDVRLYMVTGSGSLAAISRAITPAAGESLDYALTKLLMSGLVEPGFTSPFPESSAPIVVETSREICYIDIPSSALEGMAGSERKRAIDALAATIIQNTTATAITLTIDGAEQVSRYAPDMTEFK